MRKGDRVVIYMSMGVEGIAAMQACARIGATHSVVFGGFSAQSLRDRIEDAGAVMVITCDQQLRGGKALPLKAIVDEALGMPGTSSIRDVLVHRRTGGDVAWTPGRDRWLHELAAAAARRRASPSGSRPSTRCSCSTRPARPASRRACSTRAAATCCTRR